MAEKGPTRRRTTRGTVTDIPARAMARCQALGRGWKEAGGAGRRAPPVAPYFLRTRRPCGSARSIPAASRRPAPGALPDGYHRPDGNRLSRAVPRRPEPGPARGRPGHRRPRSRGRRRRLRQDARAHAPHRAPRRRLRRQAERDPRDHVHEQGRGGDEEPPGGRPRRRREPHVGHDLPRCVRPHPAPRGAAPGLQVQLHHLRLGRPGQGREGDRGGGGLGPEALRPARHPLPDLEREEPARRPGGVRASRRLLLRADRGRRVRALSGAPAQVERDGLRRPDHGHGQDPRELSGGAREVAEGLPLRPRGRVPGHEPRAVPAAAAARRRARQRLRGRRPRPVDLRLPRRGHPQHPRVRARLRRGPDDRAGAELPLDQRDPARGQLGDRQQPRAQAEEPLQRPRRGRAGPRHRGRGRACRGALRGRRDRRSRGRGRGRLRDRGVLPHERAVAGAGGRARPPGDPVPGDRRPALLRARRDQGRGRVPPGHRQPLRRRLPRPHRQPPAPRHRGRVDRPHPGVRRRAGHLALRGARPGRRRRGRRRAAQGRPALPHADAVAHGRRARAGRARAPGEGARAHRDTSRRSRPSGRSRRRAAWRT